MECGPDRIPDADQWVLVLTPTGDSPVPVGRRVAKLLKIAGRQLGLRCVSVQSVVPTSIPAKPKRKRPAGRT